MSDHGHGRVECECCHKVIQSCRCMEAGKTIEYAVCPLCRADKAVKAMQATSEANEKLKELGISVPFVTEPAANESCKPHQWDRESENSWVCYRCGTQKTDVSGEDTK